MKNVTLNELHEAIQATIGYPVLIALIVIAIIIAYAACYAYVRSQYSDEAWKVRKKNGRKSVFWYDEYGNKVYHRPKISNPPKRKARY